MLRTTSPSITLNVRRIVNVIVFMLYSQLPLRRTPLGPAVSVCLKRDVRLIESQIKGVKNGGTNSKSQSYRGVR